VTGQLSFDPCFCFDTSALSRMWKVTHRPDAFPSVWKLLRDGAAAGIVIAPREVLLELERSRSLDDLVAWARSTRQMFVGDSLELVQAVMSVEADFPNLIDYGKTPFDADPWVIALAELRQARVVTAEVDTGCRIGGMGKPRVRIPDVCRVRGVELATVSDFVTAVGAAL